MVLVFFCSASFDFPVTALPLFSCGGWRSPHGAPNVCAHVFVVYVCVFGAIIDVGDA